MLGRCLLARVDRLISERGSLPLRLSLPYAAPTAPATSHPLAEPEKVPNQEDPRKAGEGRFEDFCNLAHQRPNGWRLSGERAARVRCSRGLGDTCFPHIKRPDTASRNP
jgi:hypothetical protein